MFVSLHRNTHDKERWKQIDVLYKMSQKVYFVLLFWEKSGISQVYKVDKISLLIGYVMYNLDCIIQ